MSARADGEQLELVAVVADRATSNARALAMLVGGSVYGTIQNATGKYVGRPRRLDESTLAAHFRGEISVAIRCADGDFARFISWDLDERMTERARALRTVLARHDLLRHAILTEGSDAGRGKVVVFVRRAPQERAADLAADIMAQAAVEPSWGISTRPGTAQSKPEAGAGGLVRIGGRNIGRNGPLERVVSLETGEAVALSQVEIANLDLRRAPQPVALPRVPAYVAARLENGLPWPARGNAAVRPILMKIALHAARTGRGKGVFVEWMAQIRRHPATLAGASPKTSDERSPLDSQSINSVWAAAEKKYRSADRATLHRPGGTTSPDVMWHPTSFSDLPTGEAEVEKALREWVRSKDLHPAAFACSYREIARILGWEPKAVHRIAKRLVLRGFVVIIDRGTQGERGDKTIWSLAGTPEGAEDREVVKRRRAKQISHARTLDAKIADIATVQDRRSSTVSLPQGMSLREGALVAAASGDEEGRSPRAAARNSATIRDEGRRRTKSGRGGAEAPHEAICGCSDCRKSASVRVPTT